MRLKIENINDYDLKIQIFLFLSYYLQLMENKDIFHQVQMEEIKRLLIAQEI